MSQLVAKYPRLCGDLLRLSQADLDYRCQVSAAVHRLAAHLIGKNAEVVKSIKSVFELLQVEQILTDLRNELEERENPIGAKEISRIRSHIKRLALLIDMAFRVTKHDLRDQPCTTPGDSVVDRYHNSPFSIKSRQKLASTARECLQLAFTIDDNSLRQFVYSLNQKLWKLNQSFGHLETLLRDQFVHRPAAKHYLGDPLNREDYLYRQVVVIGGPGDLDSKLKNFKQKG